MIRSQILPLLILVLFCCPGCEPSGEKKTTNDSTEVRDTGPATAPASELGAEYTKIDSDLSEVDWASFVGKKVAIAGDLVVVDTYDLVRRGQVKIARKRLYIPTNRVDPNDSDPSGTSIEGGNNVAKVSAAQKFNDTTTIVLDDGSEVENTFPPKLFPGLGQNHPTVRVGSTITNVKGKLVESNDKIFLVPDGPLQWTPAQRPKRPQVGEADVTVASFNVLNYFTTIDNGNNGARGADSDAELKRQEAKLVAAMIELDADVIGLMELENNLQAENQLVAALNKKIGKEVFKGCGLPEGFNSAPGGQDSIRVGIIYRTDRVSEVGKVSMIRDDAFILARTPVVQSFQSNSSGKAFTLVVNHFKSKGGADEADDANKNKGDGQAAYNATRRSQALAICKYIDGLQDDNARMLVIGDLNAYCQEDPIDALRAKGLVDLQERFEGRTDENGPYSFIYYGQSGALDHAMATSALAEDITGVATWHINADEPRFLDYNQEFNPDSLYQADPFRSSDHDPVIIGIGK